MAVSDWSDLMPRTVTYKPFVSRDSYGAPTYGTAVTYSARVTYKPSRVRGFNGEEVVARGLVWIGGTPTFAPEDLLQLPDGTTPPILSIERIDDEDGSHHVKVYFG